MGRQIEIVTTAADELALIRFIESLAPIRVFRDFASSIDALWISSHEAPILARHGYHIWPQGSVDPNIFFRLAVRGARRIAEGSFLSRTRTRRRSWSSASCVEGTISAEDSIGLELSQLPRAWRTTRTNFRSLSMLSGVGLESTGANIRPGIATCSLFARRLASAYASERSGR